MTNRKSKKVTREKFKIFNLNEGIARYISKWSERIDRIKNSRIKLWSIQVKVEYIRNSFYLDYDNLWLYKSSWHRKASYELKNLKCTTHFKMREVKSLNDSSCGLYINLIQHISRCYLLISIVNMTLLNDRDSPETNKYLENTFRNTNKKCYKLECLNLCYL